MLTVAFYGEITHDKCDNLQNIALTYNSLGCSDLILYIDSGGGNLFEAITTLHILRDLKINITTVSEHLESSATILFLAGSKRILRRNGSVIGFHDVEPVDVPTQTLHRATYRNLGFHHFEGTGVLDKPEFTYFGAEELHGIGYATDLTDDLRVPQIVTHKISDNGT